MLNAQVLAEKRRGSLAGVTVKVTSIFKHSKNNQMVSAAKVPLVDRAIYGKMLPARMAPPYS
jgi:hypothetical protein